MTLYHKTELLSVNHKRVFGVTEWNRTLNQNEEFGSICRC